MREWIRSGEVRWTHGRCGSHAHEQNDTEQNDASAADSSRRSAVATSTLRHTRTPYFYNLFPHLWSSQSSQQEDTFACRKMNRRAKSPEPMRMATDSTALGGAAAAVATPTPASAASTRAAATPQPSTAMDESDDRAAAASSSSSAAAASSSVAAAVSVAAPPAPAAAAPRLTLRPRSPSHLFRLGLGSEHARRVRAQSFADDLVRLTPHISSNVPQPGAAADSMPGSRPALTPTSPTSPDSAGVSSSSSSAPLAHPIRHGGHTRYSKPISDMGDYLAVMRLSYHLRHPLDPGMEPLDDPNYVQQILSSHQAQQQQQARQAQAQAQAQANEAARTAAAAAAAASSPMDLSSWESSGSLTPTPPTLPAPPSQQPPAGLLPNPDRPMIGGGSLQSSQPQQQASPRGFPSLPAHLSHPLHVDEADDDGLPPVPLPLVVDSALGSGAAAGSTMQLMMARRQRKNQRKGSLGGGGGAPKMSWAAFLAARNGVAAAAATAAAAAAAAAAAQQSSPSIHSSAGNTPPTSPTPDRKRSAGDNDGINGSAESAPPSPSSASTLSSSPAKRGRAGDSTSLSAPSSPASSSTSPLAASSSPSHSAPVSPRATAAPSSHAPAPSLLSSLLASMREPVAPSPPTLTPNATSGPPPRSLMLRHRLESDTGSREFAASFGRPVSTTPRGRDDAESMVDAPASTDDEDSMASASAAASVSASSLAAHVSAVIAWFCSNLRDLRWSAGAGAGSVDAAEYAALFDSYRGELRVKVAGAAPHLLLQLDQSLQWKVVTDAIAATAAAAASNAAKVQAPNRDQHGSGATHSASMQQQAQRAVRA